MRLAKALARGVALPALPLLLAGCPYESSEPLTPRASAKLDVRLDGTWRCLLSGTDEVDRVTFTPFDEHQYVVAFQGAQSEGRLSLLRGQVGQLGEARFLSVQELEPPAGGKTPGWTWVRYSIVDGDLLRLRIVESALLDKDATPAQARAIVEQQLDSPALYDEDPGVCVKVAEAKP